MSTDDIEHYAEQPNGMDAAPAPLHKEQTDDSIQEEDESAPSDFKAPNVPSLPVCKFLLCKTIVCLEECSTCLILCNMCNHRLSV